MAQEAESAPPGRTAPPGRNPSPWGQQALYLSQIQTEDDRVSSSLGQNRADSTIDGFVPLGLKKGTDHAGFVVGAQEYGDGGGEWSALD